MGLLLAGAMLAAGLDLPRHLSGADCIGSAIGFSLLAAFLLFALPEVQHWLLARMITSRIAPVLPATAAIAATCLYALLADQKVAPRAGFLAVYAAWPVVVYTVARPWPYLHGDLGLGLRDVLAILGLWLPIEFGLLSGATTAVGGIPLDVAVGLVAGIPVIILVRPLPGTGYRWALSWTEARVALAAFAAFVPAGLAIGLSTGFITLADRVPDASQLLLSAVRIFVLIAITEELLFRGIIQNLVEGRFAACGRLGERRWWGQTHATWIALVTVSVLFGLAHFNGSHGGWRYMLLATLAGLSYGYTWVRTRNVVAAALVHLAVDWTWSNFLPSP